ncbi:MAG: pilus assembly protein PilP [Xanthomonadaceae bacterium]|nr:pilus assembly protein PilP [Xanthomonadaceae bacterium]
MVRYLGLAVVTIAGMTACSTHSISSTYGDAPNLRDWVEKVRLRPAPPLDPVPVMQQFETFEYTAQHMRDPFTNAWRNKEASGPRPDPTWGNQPLEQFPLDSLVVVGSIGSGPGVVGLVMTPERVTYRVHPGVTRMGQNYGRVTAVSATRTETRIELIELIPDGAGGWMERPAALALED